jgi:ABC-2 type transport system permease protein
MNDMLVVMRKELFELWGNRAAARGPLIQSGMAIVITGVLLPASGAKVWTDPRGSALPGLLLASVLAASVAADAIAGERERKTLETLLATPLSDRAILSGKVATAVVFAVTVTALSLLAGTVVINLEQRSLPLFTPPLEMVSAILGGAFGASLVTASLAVAISMRVPVARSAQQISSVISMVLGAVIATVISRLHLPLSWSLVQRIDLWLVGAGAVAIRVAGRLFQRERFFESP